MTRGTLDQMPEALGAAFADGDAAHPWRVQEGANVELLGRMMQAIAAGRFDELHGYLADDVSFEMAVPDALPWICHAHGRDEVAQAIETNFGVVREQRPEPLSLVCQGDTLMLMARESGRMAATGEPYQVMLTQQYTFRDGRLAAFRAVVAPAA
jgi:ketosteroid isomerase-like protein